MKMGVEPIVRKQFIVCSPLGDLTVLKHQNQIGIAHRRQAVGDDETGTALHQGEQGVLDRSLGASVD